MDDSIAGKAAIVTGGTGGIGRAIATRLVREGALVAVTYHSAEEAARAWVEEMEASDGRAVALRLDLRDPSAPQAVFEEARERLGEIRFLVNNAGVRRDSAIFNQEEEDWRDVMDTHLEGTYRMTRAVIVPMMKARSGVILNIASVSAILGTAGQTNYSAAKAGVIGFTRALAREAGPRGVRVNALALGLIDAGMTRRLEEDAIEPIRSRIPLGRLGTAEEVASVALFFLSDRARYVSGQVLRVDGGLAM